MRQFWSIFLALAIGFSGAIFFSYLSYSSTVLTPANSNEKAHFRVVEAGESNAVEIDGIRFENIIEGHIFPIPEEGSEDYTLVPISLKITNNSSTPKRFTRFDNLILIIVDSTGKKRPGGVVRNWTRVRLRSDFPILQPGESLTFSLDFKLMWWYGNIKLRAEDSFGGWFGYANINPGHYIFRLSYIHLPTYLDDGFYRFYNPETDSFTVVEDLWVGEGKPLFTPIQIVAH